MYVDSLICLIPLVATTNNKIEPLFKYLIQIVFHILKIIFKYDTIRK